MMKEKVNTLLDCFRNFIKEAGRERERERRVGIGVFN